ncbi:MAG: hypothetical protein J3K34DRAFT_230933 [Monoraphidium minutum]|nr:MAG: hypothetical protein J3K34DRAFT_230933 [Monoraphidium minutum]
MPLPRARRALLALLAAALLAAAPPRAAAQPPTCIDYEAVLTNTKPGGCQSANVSQALLVSPGTNTTALVFAFATIKPVTNEVLPAPTPTGAPSNRSWTFLVGSQLPG